ncbi:MAG: sulfite exporter TauE/SafE family protein [Rhodospirillales bacterium]|nr:sulfite exporter TauE/SafE family protein [Rhodospirillales bacterium]MCB9995923.1 sulfite exporter TauE/SafE family protein [Rhodospirillales bacterium]
MFDTLVQSDFYIYILFVVALITGFVGAMGGSGGLIITPFMIASGLPPQMAIGTTRVSSIGVWIITLLKFKKADKIQWEYTPALCGIALAGGLIGTGITLTIPEEWIYIIVGVTLILIAPLALFHKDLGVERCETGRREKYIGYLLYFFVSVFGGFFGGGAGLLAIFTLVAFMGFRTLEAHATDIIPWMLLVVTTSILFIWQGQVHFPYVLSIFTGMALGGHLGASLAIKKGDRWVKWFVCVFAVIVGFKLLWGVLTGA